MSFIINAKKLKKEKGYTTNDLSKITGIPLGTLSKLFSGIIEEPKLSSAIAIASALDTTVDKLCDLSNADYSADELDILQKYRKLDAHGKNLASYIISNELSRVSANASLPESKISDEAIAPDVTASNINEEKASVISKDNTVKTQIERKDNTNTEKQTTITPTPADFTIRTLPLYNTPVSAGIGEFLDSSDASTIRVKNTPKVSEASFALRVNGDSMSPEYSDGDILIIKEQNSVSNGELGIFVCDGQGYFKKFGGDRLISLNPSYPDLLLSGFTQSMCVGSVLGKLKSKKS